MAWRIPAATKSEWQRESACVHVCVRVHVPPGVREREVGGGGETRSDEDTRERRKKDATRDIDRDTVRVCVCVSVCVSVCFSVCQCVC